MLYISLFLSAVLLLIVNRAHFKNSSPSLTAAGVGVGLGLAPMFLACFMPLVALQGILLFLGSLVGVRAKARSRYFLIYSCLVTIFIYAWAGVGVSQQLDSLRQRYPLEPLSERLPSRRSVVTTEPLAASTTTFLAGMEEQLPEHNWNRNALNSLHEGKVANFVSSPRFGVLRMPYLSAQRLAAGVREERSIRQPGPRDTSSLSSELLGPPPRGFDTGPLNHLHLKGLLDFVNPQGYGWLSKRKQIAGFQPHHFSEVPNTTTWRVQTIDLVGLVVHEHPRVYVSESLPRMSELRKAPTRTLDTFELAGLEALRAGENLFVRPTPQGLRMLGGIRNVEKCTECHGGERGDLLGAFSYSLR